MAGWSEANTGSTLGANDTRPSRASETPVKRPRMKSPYVFISQVAVELAKASDANAASITEPRLASGAGRGTRALRGSACLLRGAHSINAFIA
jgi:hypothetical protein